MQPTRMLPNTLQMCTLRLCLLLYAKRFHVLPKSWASELRRNKQPEKNAHLHAVQGGHDLVSHRQLGTPAFQGHQDSH